MPCSSLIITTEKLTRHKAAPIPPPSSFPHSRLTTSVVPLSQPTTYHLPTYPPTYLPYLPILPPPYHYYHYRFSALFQLLFVLFFLSVTLFISLVLYSIWSLLNLFIASISNFPTRSPRAKPSLQSFHPLAHGSPAHQLIYQAPGSFVFEFCFDQIFGSCSSFIRSLVVPFRRRPKGERVAGGRTSPSSRIRVLR